MTAFLGLEEVARLGARLLGEAAAVSKSTVSRVCAEIKTQFEEWSKRRLDDVELDYLFLDGSHFKHHATPPVWRIWARPA